MRYGKGFSYVELLIAMMVMSVGVLGYTALQTRALQGAGDAYIRMQAVSAAANLSEHMRMSAEEPAALAAFLLDGSWTSAIPTGGSACIATAPIDMNVATLNGSDNGCSATQMAQYAIAQSRTIVAERLPAGTLYVESCDGVDFSVGAANSTAVCIFVGWKGQEAKDCVVYEDDEERYKCLMLQAII